MATESESKVKGFKRINFFKGFLTTEHDWNDAERYHIEKRRLHNKMMHAPGVVFGYDRNGSTNTFLRKEGIGTVFFGEEELAAGMSRHILERFSPLANDLSVSH